MGESREFRRGEGEEVSCFFTFFFSFAFFSFFWWVFWREERELNVE